MSGATLHNRIAERVGKLGGLGVQLKYQLPSVSDSFIYSGLDLQSAVVYKYLSNGQGIAAVALSLLVCDVCIQVQCCDEVVHSLLKMCYVDNEVIVANRNMIDTNTWMTRSLKKERAGKYFMLKKHGAAVSKTRVSASDIIAGINRYNPTLYEYIDKKIYLMDGFYNDQAAAVMLYAHSAYEIYGNIAYDYACCAVRCPDEAKSLNIVLKGIGANGILPGAAACEMISLLGRGVNERNTLQECNDRIGEAGKQQAVNVMPDATLRKIVREIYDDEIKYDEVLFEDIDVFWDRRWQWCVNGGHSKTLEKHDSTWRVDFKGRTHRRVAMENWTHNPLREWCGNAYISASQKLELGKTRLLLASDTVSYVCFEHLLRPVEAAWKNARVLLDPGACGSSGIADRITKMSSKPYYVMIDYDDFNAQHTLKAQQIVIEELANKVGYDGVMAKKLVDSFERMLLTAEGTDVGYASATLMSGHRGTTFLNSVLNAAYVRYAIGDRWHQIKTLHTGDDVIAVVDGSMDAQNMIENISKTGCRINPQKQSVGQVTGEFLRMAIRSEYAIGYLCRSVASFVAGNWANEGDLSVVEKTNSMVSCCRSIINRSMSTRSVMILDNVVMKMLPIKRSVAIELMQGIITVGVGPAYGGPNIIKQLILNEKKELSDVMMQALPSHATCAYLTHFVSDVEREALQILGTSVKKAMLGASYAKSLTEQMDDNSNVRRSKISITYKKAVAPVGSIDADRLWRRHADRGVFGKYTILHLLKNALSRSDVIRLLDVIGIHGYIDPEIKAWGADAHGIRLMGILPYSDAAALCRLTICGVVYVNYNVYM